MLKIFCTLLSILLSTHTNANLCKNDQVKLQVLGSGGPELDDGRNSSGYLIWYQDKARVLIDAGAGTSVEYGRSGAKFEDLDAILLTHLHVGHSADLAAVILLQEASTFPYMAQLQTILCQLLATICND